MPRLVELLVCRVSFVLTYPPGKGATVGFANEWVTPVGIPWSVRVTLPSKLFTETIWIVAVPDLFWTIESVLGKTYSAKSGSESELTISVA